MNGQPIIETYGGKILPPYVTVNKNGDGGLFKDADIEPNSMVSDTIGNLFLSDLNSLSIRRVDEKTSIIQAVIDQASFPQHLYAPQLFIWQSSLFINTRNAIYEWYLAPPQSP